ncbi:DUF2567 domain-containing protein, partial [Mycobacterium hodleri]|uniref:DUF2567 domain-containing protein n=1 Tax=Mycolicibacterium hodleri TaxID=49897 RepID=UPI0021F354E8
WQWRPHRGPLMVAALSVGSLAAVGAAAGVGAAVARWRHGAVDVAAAPISPEHRVLGAAAGVGAAVARWRHGAVDVAAAPISPEHRVFYTHEVPAVFFGSGPFQIAASIVIPAGVAALVYAICALSTKRDDLGAWPPVEVAYLVTPDGATGPAPTAVADPPSDPLPPSPR